MHDYILHYYTNCIRETGILFNWWNFSIICKITLELFDTVNYKSEFSLNFVACGIIARTYWKMWMCITVSLWNISLRHWKLKSLSFPLLAGIKSGVTSVPYSLWLNNLLYSPHRQTDAGLQTGEGLVECVGIMWLQVLKEVDHMIVCCICCDKL